jgi:hypothetical protein
MDEPRTIPPVVQALAQQVGKTPLDWWIFPDHITITFVEGAKMTFDREATSKTTITKLVAKPEPEVVASAPSAADVPPPPAISQSPHGSQPKAKKGKS